MVARMDREGLLMKGIDSQDARSVVLGLTALGQRLMMRRKKELHDAHRRLLSLMTADDQRTFIEALETVDRLTRKVARH
jgi:DNA-binding MarR family transcriptional regulator